MCDDVIDATTRNKYAGRVYCGHCWCQHFREKQQVKTVMLTSIAISNAYPLVLAGDSS